MVPSLASVENGERFPGGIGQNRDVCAANEEAFRVKYNGKSATMKIRFGLHSAENLASPCFPGFSDAKSFSRGMAEEISNSVASPQLKRQNFAVRANSAMEEKKRAGEEAEDQMIAREKLEEELRVIALATELNISSAISPRDMLMNTTAADFPGDEDEEKRGHDGGIEGQGYSDRCVSGQRNVRLFSPIIID